jgi:hypothetical protein
MIIFDTDPCEPEAPPFPPDIPAATLLRSCALEAERQARLLGELDSTLGAAILGLGTAPDADRIARLRSVMITDLQIADRLRQESEGLAHALDLVAAAPSLSDRVKVDALLARIPNAALRNRLLSHG